MRKLTPRVGAGVTVLLLVVAASTPTEAAGGRSALAGLLSGLLPMAGLAVVAMLRAMPRPCSLHGLLPRATIVDRVLDTTACRPAIPSVIPAAALRQGRAADRGDQ